MVVDPLETALRYSASVDGLDEAAARAALRRLADSMPVAWVRRTLSSVVWDPFQRHELMAPAATIVLYPTRGTRSGDTEVRSATLGSLPTAVAAHIASKCDHHGRLALQKTCRSLAFAARMPTACSHLWLRTASAFTAETRRRGGQRPWVPTRWMRAVTVGRRPQEDEEEEEDDDQGRGLRFAAELPVRSAASRLVQLTVPNLDVKVAEDVLALNGLVALRDLTLTRPRHPLRVRAPPLLAPLRLPALRRLAVSPHRRTWWGRQRDGWGALLAALVGGQGVVHLHLYELPFNLSDAIRGGNAALAGLHVRLADVVSLQTCAGLMRGGVLHVSVWGKHSAGLALPVMLATGARSLDVMYRPSAHWSAVQNLPAGRAALRLRVTPHERAQMAQLHYETFAVLERLLQGFARVVLWGPPSRTWRSDQPIFDVVARLLRVARVADHTDETSTGLEVQRAANWKA